MTVRVWLFSSIQTLHNKGFLLYFVTLQHRCCYGRISMAWSKRSFWCRELGMVSQNVTTTAIIGRVHTMPLVYVCAVTIVANRICRFSVNHFWADACAIQYEFIVVNDQKTSAFQKVVQRQYLSEVAKTTVICIKFFPDVACQKLLKLAIVLRSYSKNKRGTFFMDHGVLEYMWRPCVS